MGNQNVRILNTNTKYATAPVAVWVVQKNAGSILLACIRYFAASELKKIDHFRNDRQQQSVRCRAAHNPR